MAFIADEPGRAFDNRSIALTSVDIYYYINWISIRHTSIGLAVGWLDGWMFGTLYMQCRAIRASNYVFYWIPFNLPFLCNCNLFTIKFLLSVFRCVHTRKQFELTHLYAIYMVNILNIYARDARDSARRMQWECSVCIVQVFRISRIREYRDITRISDF